MEVEITSLSKNFGRIHALKSVTLRLSGNGLITFLGANGAGKTTLFKIMTSIVRPSSGIVKINGIDVNSDPKRVLSMVGSLVEQPEFYPYLTGKELLEFTGKVRGSWGKDLESEIERVSKLMKVSEYLDRKCGGYSRGMKQRLGVAVAMIGNPKLLILDEPTFGMDPIGMLETKNALERMKKEDDKLILMSTHLLDEARELSDRTIILKDGTVKYDSNGADVKVLVRVIGNVDTSHEYKTGRIIESGEEYSIFEVYERDGIPEFNRELLSSNSRVKYIRPDDRLEKEFISE